MTKPLPRCICPVVDDEPVPEMPFVKRCKVCKSWTVLEIVTRADSEAVNRYFRENPNLGPIVPYIDGVPR